MRLGPYIRSFTEELEKIAELDSEFAQFVAPALPPQLVLRMLSAPKDDWYEYRYRRNRMDKHSPSRTTWPAG